MVSEPRDGPVGGAVRTKCEFSSRQLAMERLTDIFAKLGALSSNREEGEGSQNRSGKCPMGSTQADKGHSGETSQSY